MKPDRSLILVFVACYLALFAWTLGDYGITYDSAMGELYFGDKYFYFFKSFDRQYLDPQVDNVAVHHDDRHPDFFETSAYARHHPEHIFGWGVTLTAATKHLFFTRLGWLDPIDAHHLAIGLLVSVQLLCLYLYCARHFNVGTAVGAVVCLAAYPRYWADAHNNPKDIPEAVFITLALLAAAHGAYARRAGFVVLAAVAAGLALATKPNAAFLPFILLPWLAAVAMERRRKGERIVGRGEALAWLAAPLVALAVCLAAWPYLLVGFPGHILRFVRFLAERGMGGPDHWQWLPLAKAVCTMPIAVLILAGAGAISLLVRAWTRRIETSVVVLLGLWSIVPIARVSLPHALDFDGIRHWIELVPAVAIFAGLGADQIGRGLHGWLARRNLHRWLPRWSLAAIVLLAFYAPVVTWDIRNHPFQITFYNRLIGGLKGAQERGIPESTDYWGSSYRSGLRWLNEHAERRAILIVPVEEPVVRAVQTIWLRPDIRLKPAAELAGIAQRKAGGEPGRPVYVMYVTRPEFYPAVLADVVAHSSVAHEIVVDGGVILRILRLNEPAPAT
jgi:hypothetical protein